MNVSVGDLLSDFPELLSLVGKKMPRNSPWQVEYKLEGGSVVLYASARHEMEELLLLHPRQQAELVSCILKHLPILGDSFSLTKTREHEDEVVVATFTHIRSPDGVSDGTVWILVSK